MSDIAIKVQHLGKQYRLGGKQASYSTFRETLVNAANLPLQWLKGERKTGKNTIWALDDVSFEVNQGDAIGIIGRNGAGKSTLLKILSRITSPTRGRVDIYGRVGTLLEVGTGFHPELTGRENIFLNGAILGMSRVEIQHKFDEIVAFSEIERFLDTPVKHYSSGMYVRLAFAVAAHLEPEILVVDEVLAVGDAAFQKKCLGKMGDVAHEGRTVLFVSHNMNAIKYLCNKGILLDHGTIKYLGTPEECINIYINSVSNEQGSIWISEDFNYRPCKMELKKISVIDESGNLVTNHPYDKPYFLKIEYRVNSQIANSYIAIHIHDNDHNSILFGRDCDNNQRILLKREPGSYQAIVKIPTPLLAPGNYRISVHLVLQNTIIEKADYVCMFDLLPISIKRSENDFVSRIWRGKLALPLAWNVQKNEDI